MPRAWEAERAVPKDAQTQFGTRGRQNIAPVPRTCQCPFLVQLVGYRGGDAGARKPDSPGTMFHLRMESFVSFDSRSTGNEFSRHGTATYPAYYAAFATSATGGKAVCSCATVSPSIIFVVWRLLCAWNCANADKVCWPAIPSTAPG